MQRKVFLLGAGAAVVAILLLALGSQAPAAHADPGSMSWDFVGSDAEDAEYPLVCPSDEDGNLDRDECPTVESNLWIQTSQIATSEESFFDLANSTWSTGPDDGSGSGKPLHGMWSPYGPDSRLGAKVGEIGFKIHSNLILGNLLANNVDDVINPGDPTVLGQPPRCDTTPPYFDTSFAIYNATLDLTPTVSHLDTEVPSDGRAQSQEDDLNGNDIWDGIDYMPEPVPRFMDALGLTTLRNSRSFGIAELEIRNLQGDLVSTVEIDVNFVVFNLVPLGKGYLQLTLVQYPGEPAADPTVAGYDPFGQTNVTCPPYWSSPVRVFGVTHDAAHDGDWDGSATATVLGGQISRQIVAPDDSVYGPYDYTIYKSQNEDWDGDNVSSHWDRCLWDPATDVNTDTVVDMLDEEAADTDGDTLTGLCETTGAGNGEGYGCAETGETMTAVPPWATCQDVDGDTYLNYVDNCPVVADADLDGDTKIDYQADQDADGVGDVCEIALGFDKDTPGDGNGYKTSPGMFIDRDNVCVDEFCITRPEPAGETGQPPGGCTGDPLEGKYCAVAGTNATTEPYINPQMHHMNVAAKDSNDDGEPDWLDMDSDTVADYMDLNDDSDQDKQSDACEGYNGTDPLDAASKSAGTLCAPIRILDCDGDTLKDADEETAGTDPFNPDSDGGGCLDGAEVEFGSNPLNGADDALDGDADTLPDCGDSDADSCEAYQEDAQGYSDYNWYDFYDVPVPANPDPTANGTKNAAINMGDVGAVLFYVPTAPGAANPNANGVHYDSVKGSCDWDADTTPDAEGMCYDRASSTAPNPPWEAAAPSGAVNMGDVGAVLAQVPGTCESLK